MQTRSVSFHSERHRPPPLCRGAGFADRPRATSSNHGATSVSDLIPHAKIRAIRMLSPERSEPRSGQGNANFDEAKPLPRLESGEAQAKNGKMGKRGRSATIKIIAMPRMRSGCYLVTRYTWICTPTQRGRRSLRYRARNRELYIYIYMCTHTVVHGVIIVAVQLKKEG